MKKKVLIAGAGPSAMYAVQACLDLGIVPDVVSDKLPYAQEDGAFFLHWLPPALHAEAMPHTVEISGIGTPELYTMKQWGAPIPSSFPTEPRTEVWWDSSEVMQQVWRKENFPFRIDRLDEPALRAAAQSYDYVFHTFPLASQRGTRSCKWFPVLHFTGKPQQKRIFYNGTARDSWVRMTISFAGRISIEFPDNASVEAEIESNPLFRAMVLGRLRDILPDTKPVHPPEYLAPNVIPVGRFAMWDRRALSHHSYGRVQNVVRGLLDDYIFPTEAARD